VLPVGRADSNRACNSQAPAIDIQTARPGRRALVEPSADKDDPVTTNGAWRGWGLSPSENLRIRLVLLVMQLQLTSILGLELLPFAGGTD
jgi:hypothetical protein